MSEWNWKGRGMEGTPTLATQHGEAHETRQEYANVCITQFQLTQRDLTFAELVHAFRHFGTVYDLGYRLRDFEGAA